MLLTAMLLALVSIVPAVAQGDTLTIWADSERAELLTELGQEYAEETGVEIVVREIGLPEARDELLNFGPAGEGPDILIQPHDNIGLLVENGAIVPIDLPPELEDAFNPAALNLFTYEGQLWGLPYNVENLAFVRNVELVPEAPETWQEVMEISRELQESGAADYGFLLQTNDVYHTYPIISAFGGYIFGQDALGAYDITDIGLASEGGLAAGEWLAQMYNEGLMVPNADNDVIFELWEAGDVAMFVTGPWFSERIDETAPAEYALSSMPGVEGGVEHGTPFVGGQGFLVSAFSENQLLAEEFLFDFVATEEIMETLTSRIPAFADVESADPNIPDFVDAGFNAVPMPQIPEMNSVWGAANDALVLISQGSDPVESLTTAAEQIVIAIGEAASGAINAVSVPGSFNAAVGCDSDWVPGCDEIQLTDQGDGIWATTLNIPAGDYEYKIAINRDWAENYGPEGELNSASNIPLSLAADSEVTFTYDHNTHLVTVEASEG